MLEALFPHVWTKDTSAFPEWWDEEDPSRGQCLPTAWIAQRYLGGRVMEINLPHPRFIHYVNQLPCGRVIDFTAAQLIGLDISWRADQMSELTPELFDAYRKIFPGVDVRYRLFERRFQEISLQV